ncbi:hypothetical protein EDB89DRAFT_1905185 [Lactarius sanguifluus]|nr:hypothetical protein EDB89DRAFT_1905185 [Lactarius sanguifluus]
MQSSGRRSSPSLEKSRSTHSVIHPGVLPAPGQDILTLTVFPRASLRANGIPQVRTHFCIKERSYFTVPAIQETLLLTDCFEIIVNLSLLMTDTMSRVIKFLRAFNSCNAFYWFEEASLRNTLPSPHRLSVTGIPVALICQYYCKVRDVCLCAIDERLWKEYTSNELLTIGSFKVPLFWSLIGPIITSIKPDFGVNPMLM